MIPKRAIFFWDGLPMSWLREQSIITFRALNPSWEVEVINGDDIPVRGSGRLECVLRSDWARYRRLHGVGGVYFDTDIVFCKPIPDEWLKTDLILTLGEHRTIGHVAVLGAVPGSRWFYLLDKACEVSFRGSNILNYQHFGVEMCNKLTTGVLAQSVEWLDPAYFLPVDWALTQELWREGNSLSPVTYGVHWFGGDWLSISQEEIANVRWASASGCMVAKAWRKALQIEKESAA